MSLGGNGAIGSGSGIVTSNISSLSFADSISDNSFFSFACCGIFSSFSESGRIDRKGKISAKCSCHGVVYGQGQGIYLGFHEKV